MEIIESVSNWKFKTGKIILEKKLNCYKINQSKGLYRLPNIETKFRNIIIANQNTRNICGAHKYLKIACIILANQIREIYVRRIRN